MDAGCAASATRISHRTHSELGTSVQARGNRCAGCPHRTLSRRLAFPNIYGVHLSPGSCAGGSLGKAEPESERGCVSPGAGETRLGSECEVPRELPRSAVQNE